MHKSFTTLAFAAAAAAVVGLSTLNASAATVYNTSVTPGWNVGSGQSNGNFKVNTENGIETGLRAQIRFAGPIADADQDGLYLAPAGHNDAAGPGNALWNFDYSVDLGSSGYTADNTTTTFYMDIDPSAGTNFYQWGPTLPSGTVIQDSQNIGFYGILYFLSGQSFNPDADGLYNIRLDVKDQAGALLAQNEIQVQVGNGAPSAVPLPSAASAGLSLLPLLGLSRRRRAAR